MHGCAPSQKNLCIGGRTHQAWSQKLRARCMMYVQHPYDSAKGTTPQRVTNRHNRSCTLPLSQCSQCSPTPYFSFLPQPPHHPQPPVLPQKSSLS